MKIKDFKKFNPKGKTTSYGAGLPDKPGVYFFFGSPKRSEGGSANKNILYIGKATSLCDRVKSYFGKDPEGKSTSYGAGLIETRGPLIVRMVEEANSIKWQETDSVLEALILEANLIKKYQPKYNTKEKDNKSFNYVCITKEQIPKVLIIRGRNLTRPLPSLPLIKGEEKGGGQFSSIYGPFPNGSQLKEAMRIVRRIFPYIDEQSSKKNNKEFYNQLGLTPIIGETKQKHKNFSRLNFERSFLEEERSDGEGKFLQNLREYKKNIKNLKLFFEGKKKRIISNLKKEMTAFSKSKDFENAARIRDQIFALNHINDVALIKESAPYENAFGKVLGRGGREPVPDHFQKYFRMVPFRAEGYDIAHMSGQNMVGVMTVMEDGELAKSEYKKFIIRTQTGSPASPKQGGNDTGALEEVLSRRLRHIEWGLPNFIVVDGSTAQINITKQVLNRYQFKIPVVSVVKDGRHKAKAIMGDETLIKKYKKDILLLNSEAHRFAIAFHKNRRNKNFLG